MRAAYDCSIPPLQLRIKTRPCTSNSVRMYVHMCVHFRLSLASVQEGEDSCLCLLCRSATGMALCDINRSIIESLKNYKPRVRAVIFIIIIIFIIISFL